ncbi:MAG: 9-O-acetylesterase, partial [Gemmatimonadota bacterium]
MGTIRAAQRGALVLAAVGLLASAATAEVRLPAIFGDHMVLQQQQPIRVWGWAEPGEQVTVHLGRHRARATADGGGRWQVELPARKAGGPTRLVVEGANRLELTDVLVGEVWIG